MSSDFYRVDPSLPESIKLQYLNEMILKLAGKIEQGKYDVNEIASLYNSLGSGYTRAHVRNTGIGNTLATYSGWTHYKAESAYSIWKIQPTAYVYSANNQVFMDNMELENKGEATALTSQFDSIFTYDQTSGVGYADVTTDISTEGSDEVTVIEAIGDYLYIGSASTFAGVSFEFLTPGSNYTNVVEYYDSRSGYSWTELEAGADSLVDNTNDFASNGAITFTAPTNWGTVEVNSTTKYWIRISTSTTPVTAAEVYYCTSGDSVEGLLALSSNELIAHSYKFCTYNGYIYVTIPNAGAAAYEGTDFITSSSSTANKQNFFIYEKPFTGNWLSS